MPWDLGSATISSDFYFLRGRVCVNLNNSEFEIGVLKIDETVLREIYGWQQMAPTHAQTWKLLL